MDNTTQQIQLRHYSRLNICIENKVNIPLFNFIQKRLS